MIPRPEHPSPIWQRDSFVNLNGEWQFEIDHTASGWFRELWKKDSLEGKITLPFCPESELSGIGYKDFMLAVWYKKKLTFSEDELKKNRVILHFGAADFETYVYVNGRCAGLPHVGGGCSFEYDITALLSAGENDITVGCKDDTRSPRQAGGKQSTKYDSYGCYYTRTTGIWQTVWYELVPKCYVKYAKITPDLDNTSVALSLELVGAGDASVEVLYDGKTVGKAEKKNASVVCSFDIPLSERQVWELGDGRLYDVVIRFGEDKVKSYFGLRKVELRDGKFYLNGRSVFQRLILDQGFYHDGIWTAPTEEALIKDIEISMAAGFNGARLHQKVFEPRFLYNADRLGYMVWGEYNSWAIDHSDIANLSTFLPDWLSEVRRDYNHPAIIGWCPFNETWNYGDQGKAQDNEFLRILYEQTKLADPTRPCIDTSGNYHVITDIYDIHDYEQNPEIFKNNYDKLPNEGILHDRHSPARQKWHGEPVFMSEYGGIGIHIVENADNSGRKSAWSYGKSCTSYEEFYDRYKGLTHALLDNPKMIGFCYTQLTDVEQEVNGLYEYKTRAPKFDIAKIKEINTKHAAIED